jgi:protein-S-isoprenylcysteine O-methyltransferase Ste14
MFGLPLMFYITSPFFGGDSVPVTLPIIGKIYLFKHYFPLGWTGTVIGSYITLIGMVLVFFGWYQIHKSPTLVKKGLYKYARHPQYTGLFLIITGWMLHWATTITVVMYPVLIYIYFRLSLSEEKKMKEQFGVEYADYKKRTWMFFPLPLMLKNRKADQ